MNASEKRIMAVTTTPILVLIENGLQYSVDTDALAYKVGAVLFRHTIISSSDHGYF